MLFIFITLALSSMIFAQEKSPVLDPDKFTICAITINSDDEKKIFQAQAAKNPKKFNPVIELTDFGEGDWFAKACSSGVRCDQLVVSGHFAGDFFGESNKRLSLTELEKAGCSKTCEGILNQPYEVFLFGCNTLAEKDGDHRTPAQYLQVLLQDGIPLARAEMVVQSRYGTVGDSSKAGMQRAFGGELKQLYGFHSVGPSGKNVKGFINNYFAKISAADQLEKQMAKRMMGKVEMANKALAESLKSTAFTQCLAANGTNKKSEKVCGLLDERKSKNEKLDLTLELLSQEDYLLYLPAINIFMQELKDQTLTAEEQKSFDLIKNNSVLKEQILGLINQTKGLGLKGQWMLLARNMGYLTSEETSQRLSEEVSKIFAKPISDNDVEILCSLEPGLKNYLKISDNNIKNRSVGLRELQAFSCLMPLEDGSLVNRLVNAKTANNPELLARQLDIATSSSNVSNLKIPQILKAYAKKQLISNDVYMAGEGLRFIAKFYPEDPEAIKRAFKFIENSKDNEYDAFDGYTALNIMRTKDAAVLNKVLTLIKNPNGNDDYLLQFVINSKSDDQKVQKEFAGLLNDNSIQEYQKEKVLLHIQEMKSSSSAVVEEVIKYIEVGKDNYYHNKALEILKGFELSPDLKERVDKIH
jgi:hypothetical protein